MKYIRKFDEGMMDDVMRIWLDVNREAHDFIPCCHWEKNYKNMRNVLSGLNVYVYHSNGEIKGFVGITDEAHIAGVYVDKAYRREGIGSMLLQKCKEEHDRLTIEVYLKNEKALEFYKKNGFHHFKHKVDIATIEREFILKWVSKN